MNSPSSKITRYFTEIILLGIVLGVYLFGFYYHLFLIKETKILLISLYAIYSFFILPYHLFIKKSSELFYHSDLIVKFLVNLKNSLFLHSENKIFENKDHQTKVLFFIVRIIFIPAMTNFLVIYIKKLLEYFNNGSFEFSSLSQNFKWYFFITAITVVVDLLYFSLGYLVESKRLNNTVKSVDTTALGWLSAMACYVPFNMVTNSLLPMYARESIFFVNPMLTTVLYIFILLFYFIYLSATLSLGTKCGNLTNRGIISGGAYKFIRHPAYLGKLMSWWLLCIPIMNVKVLISMLGWSLIYILRAMTEERHLAEDTDYLEYRKTTKWRFIPGIF